jgi:hypothetical protein
MFDAIPGNPSTTASTMTSTMTPAISRTKEGIIGSNAPQVPLFEVESVIFFNTEAKILATKIFYCRNPEAESLVTV